MPVKSGGPRQYDVSVKARGRTMKGATKWARSKIEAIAKALRADTFSEVRVRDLPKRTATARVGGDEFLFVVKTDDLTGARAAFIARRD